MRTMTRCGSYALLSYCMPVQGFNAAVSREQILNMAFTNGRLSVTNVDDGGTISPPLPADLLLLDWAAIDDDRLRDDVDTVELVLTRATSRHIRELIVAGRTVVKDGRLPGVDMAAARVEVLAQMRAGMGQNEALAAAMPALDHAMAMHFEPGTACS